MRKALGLLMVMLVCGSCAKKHRAHAWLESASNKRSKKAKFKGVDTLVYATDLNVHNLQSANSLLPLAGDMNAELVFLFVDNKIHTDSEKLSEEMAEKIFPSLSRYPPYDC